MKASLEDEFAGFLHQFNVPKPETQYRFHPTRKWRFDFAWPHVNLAVEIDGLVRSGKGRHQTFKGMANDLEKRNAAVMCGWRVLHYSQIDLKQRPVQVIEEVKAALGQ